MVKVVLSLAVQCQAVPQDPNDEPAASCNASVAENLALLHVKIGEVRNTF